MVDEVGNGIESVLEKNMADSHQIINLTFGKQRIGVQTHLEVPTSAHHRSLYLLLDAELLDETLAHEESLAKSKGHDGKSVDTALVEYIAVVVESSILAESPDQTSSQVDLVVLPYRSDNFLEWENG